MILTFGSRITRYNQELILWKLIQWLGITKSMKPLPLFFPTWAKFSPLPHQIFPWKADTSSWIIYSIRFQVLLASIAHSFWMDNKQQSNESIRPPSKSTMNRSSGQILKSAISSQQLLWNPTTAKKESKNWKKVKSLKINESTWETT